MAGEVVEAACRPGVTSTKRNRAARSSWSCAASSIALLVERLERMARPAGKRRVDRAPDSLQLSLHRANHMLPRVPDLVLGPLLRYVGETEASSGSRPTRPARSRCSARASAPSAWRATTTRSSAAAASSPGTWHEYEVRLDGERVWPRGRRLPAERLPHLSEGDAAQVVFGSCRVAAPHEPPYSLRKDEDERGREIDALHTLAQRDARQPRERVAGRAADARRPGLRRRGLARHARVHRERGATRASRPGSACVDFEEYTQLYRESWSDPTIRWLLSTRLDGDDLRRPRRPRRLEHLAGLARGDAREGVVARAHRRRARRRTGSTSTSATSRPRAHQRRRAAAAGQGGRRRRADPERVRAARPTARRSRHPLELLPRPRATRASS